MGPTPLVRPGIGTVDCGSQERVQGTWLVQVFNFYRGRKLVEDFAISVWLGVKPRLTRAELDDFPNVLQHIAAWHPDTKDPGLRTVSTSMSQFILSNPFMAPMKTQSKLLYFPHVSGHAEHAKYTTSLLRV